MKKLWKILNGNKSIICSLLLLLLQFDFFEQNLSANNMGVLQSIIGLLLMGSIAHHVNKGKLNPKRN